MHFYRYEVRRARNYWNINEKNEFEKHIPFWNNVNLKIMNFKFLEGL